MIDVRQRLQLASGLSSTYYSLPQLEKRGGASKARQTFRRYEMGAS
jgi:hypothetical protein